MTVDKVMSSVDKADKARAMLALQAKAKPEVAHGYAQVSDEELALMLHDELEPVRRAQLMDLIANDQRVYRRWIALVETADTVGLAGFAVESAEISDAKRDAAGEAATAKVLNFVQSKFRFVATAGGSLAAAASVFLMISGDPQYRQGIDDLYSDYGSSWTTEPTPLMETRSLGTSSEKQYTAEENALKTGIEQGLKKMGPAFQLHNFSISDHALDIHGLDNEYATLMKATGELAALTYFKCRLAAGDPFFARSATVIKGLGDSLKGYDYPLVREIYKNIQRTAEPEAYSCRFAKDIVGRFIQ